MTKHAKTIKRVIRYKQKQSVDSSLMIAFICQPYLAVLQKMLYEKYWKNEVSEVLINVNGCNDTTRQFIVDLWSEATYIDEIPTEIRQGTAFDRLYPMVKGKVVITLDSDCFIYKKGIIRKHVDSILSGKHDAVGSVGHHINYPELGEKIIKKYGTVRLNPFMSFWKRSIVDNIPNNTFTVFTCRKGEKHFLCDELDKDIEIDVMGYFSLQFFELSDKIKHIPTTKIGSYVHVSALSSIYRRCFRGLESKNVHESKKNKERIGYWAWYYLIYEATKDRVPFPDYNKEYEKEFIKEVEKADVTLKEIIKEADKFKEEHKELFK